MKKILALLLVLAMAVSFVACAAKTEEPAAESAKVEVDAEVAGEAVETEAKWDTTKQDEIVVSYMNNYYNAGWDKVAEEYMALHPETTITYDVIADNDTLSQKFVTWFSSDDLTDASDITHINFAGVVGGTDLLMERGQVYDFTNLLDETNPYTGTTVRSYLEDADISSLTEAHGMSALPFDHVAVAMMVNTDMLAANGLEVPTTYEELVACCAALKEAGVETPVLSTPEGTYFISSLGDAAMRDMYGDFLIMEGDGEYDAATMAANAAFVNDITNPAFDYGIKISGERKAAYIKENGRDTALSVSIWNEYCKLAVYYNDNYRESASTEVLSSFEMQNGAFLISGSWNVGVLNKDIQEMGEDGFAWQTIAFPSFETTPEGWATGEIRSLYGMGNQMGVIKTHGDDEDHLNRVLDFIMYVYSPAGCATMFQETLNAGYFVQGNPAIKGVNLPEEINAKLAGFIQESPMRSDLDVLFGNGVYMAEDQGTYNDAFNKMTTGELDGEGFLAAVKAIQDKSLDDEIAQNGWDLDPATKDEHV